MHALLQPQNSICHPLASEAETNVFTQSIVHTTCIPCPYAATAYMYTSSFDHYLM